MLDDASVRRLLTQVAQQQQTVEQALESLRCLPFEKVDGFACLDHHRSVRRGCPEVIFCAGKTPPQVAAIAAKLAERGPRILGTRASRDHFEHARGEIPDLQYDETARCIWIDRDPRPLREGVLLIAAGTSDMPVAEEAARTLTFLGHEPSRLYDVGVAGLHRILSEVPRLNHANVIIVAAGMEGALPSVVAGLVSCPLIALPTSVGYGASFGGLAALLSMLNTCASGVGVVNIDNGFGAAYSAGLVWQQVQRGKEG